MTNSDRDEEIIKNYQRDEQMMIFIFAQWCINHDLDPAKIYTRAYPKQSTNIALTQAIELTVSKEESGDIADDTLLGVVTLFGNEELAYVITKEIEKRA